MTSSLFPAIIADRNGIQFKQAGYYHGVNGTGEPTGTGFGFAADVGRILMDIADGMWIWLPVAYPAVTFPMLPSIMAGVDALVASIMSTPLGSKTSMGGYSQGAVVVGKTWRDECLNPKGRLHDRYLNGDFVAIFTWGDPMRCPGIAHGNELAGLVIPGSTDGVVTGGIAGPDDLKPEETPDFYYSRCNINDLYGSCPTGPTPWASNAMTSVLAVSSPTSVLSGLSGLGGIVTTIGGLVGVVAGLGDQLGIVGSTSVATVSPVGTGESQVGQCETMVYNIVLNFSPSSVGDMTTTISNTLKMPLTMVVPVVEAVLNGFLFVATGFSGHGDYDSTPAAQKLVSIGQQLLAA